jgi:hypothetical protein
MGMIHEQYKRAHGVYPDLNGDDLKRFIDLLLLPVYLGGIILILGTFIGFLNKLFGW